MSSIKKNYLQCPICMEIPLAEVYQCENGHMLCHQCTPKVGPNCPQCRVPFGRKKIRNLIAEATLDDLFVNMPCPSAKYGCFQIMKNRQEAEAHNKTCSNRFRAVNICREIGYPYCKTKVRTGGGLIEHLLETHGIKLDRMAYSWKTVVDVFDSTDTTQYFLRYLNATETEVCLFVLKVTPDLNKRKLSCAASMLYLGDGPYQNAERFMAKIVINGIDSMFYQMVHMYSWTGCSVHFKKAAEDEEFIPSFNTSVNLDSVKSQLETEGDYSTGFQVRVKLIKAGSLVYYESGSDSSDEYSSDDSDGSQLSVQRRSLKRHLESDLEASTKRMKRDSTAICRCINCKVHTNHLKKR